MIWPSPIELRKLQVVFSRIAPTGVATDPAVCTFHFVNLTNNAPDSTWTDADFVTAEDAFRTAWNGIKNVWTTGTVLDQLRWYKAGSAFTPTPPEGNPAVRILEENLPGTAAVTPCPPQVAISVTERTALRRRWGRFYLPAPSKDACDQHGVLGQGLVDLFVNSFETMYETCRADGIVPVVFSPTVETAYEVEKLQVDNLFDVIRSRRWKAPSIRAVRTLT